MEIIQDVDKQFSQWRVKPIVIPSYNFLGKETRLDWSENTVRRAILAQEKEVTNSYARCGVDVNSQRVLKVIKKKVKEEMKEASGFLTNWKGKKAQFLGQEFLIKNVLCNKAGLLVQDLNSFQ